MNILDQVKHIERSSRDLGFCDACEILMMMREREQSEDGRRVLGDAIDAMLRKVGENDQEGSHNPAEVDPRG